MVRSVYTRRIVEEGIVGVWERVCRRVAGFVEEKIEEAADADSKGRSGVVDALMMARLFAADVGSSVVYGEENALNVLNDQEQRREFEADLRWSDNRLLSLWTLFMVWYPDLAVRLQRLGIAPGSMNSEVPKSLVMDRKGREVLQKTLNQWDESQGERQESLMERLVAEFRERGHSAALPDTKYVLSDTLDHFWAAVTTTGDALGAVFYQLSHPQNKRHQDRLREALKSAGVSAHGDVSLAMVKSIEYLDFVIRETLRHSPPIPFSLTRKVTAAEGMEILGYWLPPGVSLREQGL